VKKWLIAAILGGSAVVCSAQNRFPPINVANSDPTGVACTIANALEQYAANIFICTSGTWHTVAGSGSGVVSGQANGVIPLSTGSTTIGGQSPLTVSAGDITASGAFQSKTLGGRQQAAQWQTGGGNNGITNAFTAPGQMVVADPSYASTDNPFTYNGTHSTGINQSLFQDTRAGQLTYIHHNPAKNNWVGFNDPFTQVTISDTQQNPPTGTGSITNEVNSLYQWDFMSSPNLSLGASSFGASGWSIYGSHRITSQINSPGIGFGAAYYVTKAGIGDNEPIDLYGVNYGGATAAADEGNHILRMIGGEAATQYAGAVAAGSTGATSITVNCTQDCANPGDGRYLMLSATVLSGNVTAHTVPSGNTPGKFTVDATATPSTAWGTMNGNCNTPVASPIGTASSFMTCNVTMLSGTFSAGDLVCFSGQFHEQVVLTAATSTSITAPLRHQHGNATWIMANGPCGQFIDLTANDTVVSGVTLNFPFDIIGATDSHTLDYAWFYQGSGTTTTAQLGQAQLATFSATSLSNTGGVVTMTLGGGVSITTQSQLLAGNSIAITNSIDTTYNGTCTNATLNPSTTNQLQCTQASSIGSGASASATIAWGTNGFGNTAFITRNGAEVLDVNTYSSGYGSVSPGNVTTFTLEPNVAAWASSAAVIQPHHATWHGSEVTSVYTINNASSISGTGMSWVFQGPGVNGGTAGSGGSFADFAVLELRNSEANNNYVYHGGLVTPPGGIKLNGAGGTGEFNYGLAMAKAPGPINANAIRIGPPVSGTTDYNYVYNLFRLDGNGADSFLQYRPFFNEMTFTSDVGNVNLMINGNLAKTTFNDNIVGAALATPALPTLTASTSGGTLADATSYCYTVVVSNTSGATPQSAERCVTTGTSGGVNSIQVAWARAQGARSYKVCGRTTGAELLMFTVPSGQQDITRWIDNGSVTPSGACSTTNTTLPGIDMFAYAELSDGTFWAKLLPNTMTGNINVFLPKDLTSSLALVNEPTSATVSGDVATYNSVLGQIHDSGVLLTSLTKTITSGTSAMGTGAITAGTCATVVTTTATGTLTTDSIKWSFNAAPGTGYTAGLNILNYVTANNVNFLVCNPTAGSLTPAAATLNWSVTR